MHTSTPSRPLRQLERTPTSAGKKLDRWGNPYYSDWAQTGKTRLAQSAAPASAPPSPAAAAVVADATIEYDVLNSGSTARDHLANERTFLAWARTGLGFVGLGVGLAEMKKVEDANTASPALPPPSLLERAQTRGGNGEPDGARAYSSVWSATAARGKTPELLLIGVGGIFLSYAAWRYRQVQKALLVGAFPVNRVGIGAVVASSSLVTLAGLGMVLTPRSR
jgi:uncharacterized membrane protein YidH (DUF202 family)